jgi:3-phenylpropionate/trans-cinnamate dioxygenase ferredoxin reductase component
MVPEKATVEGRSMPDTNPMVIAGAALAGAKAAEALREEGFEGPIVLVGAEDELPYERPPLSKDYLRGESPREQARVHPEEFYADKSIELRLRTTVERIDPAAGAVELSTGERLAYDKLLIATGAEPRRLPIPGADLEGVHYLRDLDDADAIAARLNAGGRALVIGGGWIGAEVAASARTKGLGVTLVEMEEVPLGRVLGRQLGSIYADIHRDHGVELLTGATVERLDGAGRFERATFAGGETREADFVVVGIGVVPRTRLAEEAGIAVDNGVSVDERLETSLPGVFATGDVAGAMHPFYGRRVRVEHWATALHQPEIAARAMLGKPAAWDKLPYFFSDQYDVGMELSGEPIGADEVVYRGDPATREFIAFWLQDGRVVAGMNVNVWDVTDAIAAIIQTREPVDVARLRDPDVPLEALGGAGAG